MENSTENITKFKGKNDTDLTSMQCSWKLKKFLQKHGFKGESDEQTIWRLFSQLEPNKQIVNEAKEAKATYENKL